jgi:glycosyltransferase involved in cell wall biosynthesis
VIGLFARITPMKGQKLFVEAAIRLKKKFPDARFLIVGAPFLPSDEAYSREVLAHLKNDAIQDSVTLVGHLENPYPAMAACDVVVNASIAPEPFGLTLIEAMMLGKPVIAPALGGPCEIVGHDRTGLLFKPGDVGDLFGRMEALTLSAGARARLGAAARKDALNRFSIPRMISELEAAYEKSLS